MALLHDLDLDDYLVECVSIEPAALTEEYVRLPANVAYWSERHARTREALLRAKAAREHTAARVRLEVRERLTLIMPDGNGGKARAPTEATIEAHITLDPDYQQVKLAELEAEVAQLRVAGILEALRAKRDSLVGLGATVRQEMQLEPRIRDEVRHGRVRTEENREP